MNETHSLFVDFWPADLLPRRGDRLNSPRTVYWVLHARLVKRRDPQARPRVQMVVIKDQDIGVDLVERLYRSASRRSIGSQIFTFTWYPRKRKAKTFEQFMGAR